MNTSDQERVPLGGGEQPSRSIFRTGAEINGRYRILKRLGSGATGSVFQALDTQQADRVVALKGLVSGDLDDPTTVPRFKNEFQLAQQIKHPNVIEIYDLSQTEFGQLFMTMEFVDGITLRERIKSRTLTFIEVMNIIRDVAMALACAHKQNIVHRDLKPDNILVRHDGVVKIVDLGLARNMADGNSLTKTGEAVGSPHYMAPEQIQGKKADGRADIYALGIIAFEIVTGVPPYIDKQSYTELVHAHLTQPIPSFSDVKPYVANVPEWFEVFVLACTEKSVEHRMQTMDDVARAIEKRMIQMGLMQGVFAEQPSLISRMFKSIFK